MGGIEPYMFSYYGIVTNFWKNYLILQNEPTFYVINSVGFINLLYF